MSATNNDVLMEQWNVTREAIRHMFRMALDSIRRMVNDGTLTAYGVYPPESARQYRAAAAWLIAIDGGQSDLSRDMERVAKCLQDIADTRGLKYSAERGLYEDEGGRG